MMVMDQTSETVSKPQLNAFLDKSRHSHGALFHSNRILTKTEVGYCCDRPDHVDYWQNVDFGTLDQESS